MTIRKTIEIPDSREVHFDVTLPETAPCGKTEVVLEFPQKTDDFTYPPDFDPRPARFSKDHRRHHRPLS
jgi:hypothetical protein